MAVDVSSIVVGIGSPALVALGTWIGKVVSDRSRKHRAALEKAKQDSDEAAAKKEKVAAEAQAARDRSDAERDNLLLELTWAIRGKEKTTWEPARKGLSELMKEHAEADEQMFKRLNQHQDDFDNRLKSVETKV